MKNLEKLSSILSNILELEEDEISDKISPENTPTWDSFNALVLVTELEDTFKVNFTIEDIESVSCVGDIKECLKKYNISF